MTDRISCCVPFCRRTHANPKGWVEWVCGKHWAMVSKSVRRRRAKVQRAIKRESDPDRVSRLYYCDEVLWRKGLKQAIERAAGI